MLMNQQDIMEIIPHRAPFILIDSVTHLEGNHVTAFKHVTGDEQFFKGHFPEFPVMPGVLIVEAMAQAGALLILSQPAYRGKLAFFGGMDKVRFKRKVLPGDTLRLEVTINKIRSNIGFATGQAFVGDDLAASAEIICAIGG
jgi:3-hydroxyacyl-[acyl-carrier-protein] dehydratase